MERPTKSTERDRRVAEEAISHEEANFPETPTGQKLVKQTKIMAGFFLLIVGVLFGLLVASFSSVEEPTANPNNSNQLNQ